MLKELVWFGDFVPYDSFESCEAIWPSVLSDEMFLLVWCWSPSGTPTRNSHANVCQLCKTTLSFTKHNISKDVLSLFVKNFPICFLALFTVCKRLGTEVTCQREKLQQRLIGLCLLCFTQTQGTCVQFTSALQASRCCCPVAIRPDSRRPFYRGHLKKHKRLRLEIWNRCLLHFKKGFLSWMKTHWQLHCLIW